MMLNNVMDVQLEVPRVVKQNFVIAAEEWDWKNKRDLKCSVKKFQ